MCRQFNPAPRHHFTILKMKKLSPALISNLLIVAIMFAMGYLYFDHLPEQIATHWNTAGEADSFMNKSTAIILFPSIALFFTILFPLLKKIDPKNENYKHFKRAWGLMQVGIIGFLAYIYFVTLYAALNSDVSVSQFVIGGVGALIVIIGVTMRNIHQNFFVGIRTPWTLSSEKVWEKTHKLGGTLFTAAGLVIFIEAFILIKPFVVMMLSIFITILATVIYSYYAYKNLN